MADVIRWRKSSYSGSQSECVEVALTAQRVFVRDTKNRDGGTLSIAREDWAAVIWYVKREER